MKIVDKTKDKKEEQWQLGDVLKDKDGYKALIVQNDNKKYCLMDIDTCNTSNETYSTNDIDVYGNPCSSVEELYSKFEHFEYSYKILPAKSNPDKKTFKDLIDSWRKDIKRRQNL